MTQELKQAFQLKRDGLIEQREAFNYEVEDRKVGRKRYDGQYRVV